jgi:hypothetical protein
MALAGLGTLQILGHFVPHSGVLRVAVVSPLMAGTYVAVRLVIGGAVIRAEIAILGRWVLGIARAPVNPQTT